MPTRNDYFAEFKDARLGTSNTARRVGHSFTNYFQSIDRGSFGIQDGKNPLKDGFGAFGAKNVRDATANAASTGANLLGTGGMAAGIVTLSAASLATAATIAALSGPQAAIVGGVIGIALVAKSAYSNRESAHAALTKYCWSLIDDVPPEVFTADNINEASSAALTLMEDGKNQIKLLASKLDHAKSKLDAFHRQLQDNEKAIGDLPLRQSGQAGTDTIAKIKALKEKSEQLIAEAKKPNGAIYEYTRRIIHTSNYIQAPHVIALAMKERHSPGSVTGVGVLQPDYFAETNLGKQTRAFFTQLAKIYIDIVTPPSGHRAGGDAVRAARTFAAPVAPPVVRSRS